MSLLKQLVYGTLYGTAGAAVLYVVSIIIYLVELYQ